MNTLARKLKAIREPRMRAIAVARFLAGETDQVMATIGDLITRVQRDSDPDDYAAIDALVAALADPELIDYDTRAALYASAKQAGHDELARMMFSASPDTGSEVSRNDDLEPERAVQPRGRTLTLGERKSLARTHRRDLIAHLLRDPHPAVVEILLGNPHMTEDDVVRIASRRPNAPTALETIATNRRWRVRYPVKQALVMNPHTPTHVGIRLAMTLRFADLQAVSADQNLAPQLRQQAADLLTRRR